MKKLVASAFLASLVALTGCPKSKTDEKKVDPTAETKPTEAKPTEAVKPTEAAKPADAKK
jgi:hypothetical protein